MAPCNVLLFAFLCWNIHHVCHCETEDIVVGEEIESENSGEKTTQALPKPTELEKYKMRFGMHRNMHSQIMKSLMKKVEKPQMSSLITGMVTNLFRVMIEARANLTRMGHVPGDDFPEERPVQESLSKVLENTFMFGDLLLSRPTPVHALYDPEIEWKDTLTWSYHLCSKSGVFDASQQQYLDLIAMEAGILPKDANFNNPFLHESEKPRKKFEDPKPPEKKKAKKLARGPKMSHVEL